MVKFPTHTAAFNATKAQKLRAQIADSALGDQTKWDRSFVYNAVLNLLHQGVAPTEKNVLGESARLGREQKARYEA